MNVILARLPVSEFGPWLVGRVYHHVERALLEERVIGVPISELADWQAVAAIDPEFAERTARAGKEHYRHDHLARQLAQVVTGAPEAHRLWSAATPRQREVIELRYIDGLSTQETADRLHLTPEAVRSHISHARRRATRQGGARPRLRRHVRSR